MAQYPCHYLDIAYEKVKRFFSLPVYICLPVAIVFFSEACHIGVAVTQHFSLRADRTGLVVSSGLCLKEHDHARPTP